MTIWKKLQNFPPVLVRLLAKDGRNAMTDRQIVEASDGALTLADVKRLSLLDSWEEVNVRHLREFTTACRVDLSDRNEWRNACRYMKRPKFEHLRTHQEWPYFRELLAVYAETLKR